MNDRDYERMERRRRTRRKSVAASVAAIAVILVAIAAIVIAIVAVVSKNSSQGSVAETAAVTEQPTLYQPSAQEATSALQPTSAYSDPNQGGGYQPATQPYYYESDDPEQPYYEEPQTPEATYAEGSANASDGALHFYAHGKTSYGYDWTYSGGGGIVNVTCKYNFDLEQYDFTVTGLSEGVTDLTLIYNTADGQTESRNMTVSVDSNLNVSEY